MLRCQPTHLMIAFGNTVPALLGPMQYEKCARSLLTISMRCCTSCDPESTIFFAR